MAEGRFSTIRFNEWICITAQYEKTVARIGRQVYQGYSRGLLVDFTALEICKQISDTFAEARSMREELEEELERDALDGLNVEETKIADEHRSLTQAQKTKRTFKLKIAKFMGRAAINRKLAAHRDQVREYSRDLGMRALACYKDNPLLKVKGHKSLCRLADQLNEDADVKWQEIVKTNKENGGGLSFHTILINFVGSFANFGKNTPLGRAVLKYFKYDEAAENKKLKEAYQGSATAEVLRAQLEEIEEPHLDVGREIDSMQQEYEETPVEWNLPSLGNEPESYPSFTPPAPEQATEKWEPEADTWEPDTAADDDFLDAVAEVPAFEPAAEPTPPPAPSAGPTLLRRRPEPEAESWNEPPNLPSISRDQGPPAVSAGRQEAAGEEWDWSNSDSADAWEAPEPPTNPTPSLQQADPFVAEGAVDVDPFDFGEPGNDPFAADSRPTIPQRPSAPATPSIGEVPKEPSPPAKAPQSAPNPAARSAPPQPANPPARSPAAAAQDGWGAPAPAAASNWSQEPAAASRPPFVKSQQKEQPLGDWSGEPTPPAGSPSSWSSEPAPPASLSSWGTEEPDYGWSTPQASKPAAPPTPAAPQPPSAKVPETPPFAQPPQTPPPAPAPTADSVDDHSDPLLKLLRSEDQPAPSPPGDDLLDDDLLPDFLKNRDDEESSADDAFIPELPSFLASDDGPQLEILPFGSKENMQPVKPGDDSDEEPFIPQMPDL